MQTKQEIRNECAKSWYEFTMILVDILREKHLNQLLDAEYVSNNKKKGYVTIREIKKVFRKKFKVKE